MVLAIAILLAGAIHEGGHYWAARFFGKRLKFRFAWGRFGVPRFTLLHLIDETLPLIDGIVELGKAIRQLAAVNEELEAVGKHGVIGVAFRQR